jgi:antitoxin component YwqK of YwqJK toxin-antitoxin module
MKTNMKETLLKNKYKVVKEYNNNGQLIKQINYRFDNKRIYCIDEYNTNKKLIRKIYYCSDGKTITKITEFNENKTIIKETIYYNKK